MLVLMRAKKQNCTLCDFVGRDIAELDAHLNSTHKDFLITLFRQHIQAALHRERLDVPPSVMPPQSAAS